MNPMRIKNSFPLLAVLIGLWFIFPSAAQAKRLLPQAKTKTTSGTTTVNTNRIGIKVKFRSDRKAVVATFSNLSVATKVDYFLSYSARGTTQGASGSVSTTAEDPTTREVIFGTCSHGVCRYDSGITNGKLVVTTTLTSGKKVAKTFRLKV
jgi:hypothetical protein